MISTMFIGDITVIDHAFVTSLGEIVGNSLRLSVEVEGKVDETEQVVIDFSACKKKIKHIVDDSEFAVDHRLIIHPESGCDIRTLGDGTTRIETDNGFEVTGPIENDWFVKISDASYLIRTHEFVLPHEIHSVYLKLYLERILLQELASLGVTRISVQLDDVFIVPSEATIHVPFTYVHGLRNSSSYGCKNIAHGHRSFIAVDAVDTARAEQSLRCIAEDMNRVLIDKQNITHVNANSEEITLEYKSTRGKFKMTVPGDIGKVLSTETTVENLAEYIANTYRGTLLAIGARRVWVSEGLSKGAVVTL